MSGGGSLASLEIVLVVLAAALAAGFAFWIYLRREPPVRGRFLLASLRAVTLILLILLFWNPAIPASWGGGEVDVPTLLLDASLSMGVAPGSDTAGGAASGAGSAPTQADAEGASAWERAVEQASELAGGGGRVLLFGSSVRAGGMDSVRAVPPSDPGSRLAPALERAASLGAVSVEVVSDFRLEDPVSVSRVLESTGLGVRYVDVGFPVRNAGLAEVAGPASLPAGEESALEVLLAGEVGPAEGIGGAAASGTADSVTLDLRVDDRLVESRRVPLPMAGRTSRHALPFVAPSEEGGYRLRVEAALSGDAFEPDDLWTHYLEVEEGRSGLVVLSLEAAWEPRYMIPVLEQVAGLRGRGFIRLAGGRWLSMGQGVERAGIVDEEEVRRLAEGAEIVVVQGLGSGSPGWIRELAASQRRVVVAAGDASVGPLLGVELTEPRTGEWYVSPDLPSSPLAGELAGTQLEGLPPLVDHLRLVTPLPEAREPLMARQGRQGPLDPVVALLPGDGRRTALVLASGFWRWAARDGAPRETYRRLWSGVAGWLLEEVGEELEATVEPARRPALRDRPVEWRVRGVEDTLRLRVFAGSDSVVVDTTIVNPPTTVRTSSLDPGPYRFVAEASGLTGGAREGTLEVTRYSDDLLRPRVEPPGVGAADRSPLQAGAGRPLRTHPVPYLLLIALLCAEWIGRRRQGLR